MGPQKFDKRWVYGVPEISLFFSLSGSLLIPYSGLFLSSFIRSLSLLSSPSLSFPSFSSSPFPRSPIGCRDPLLVTVERTGTRSHNKPRNLRSPVIRNSRPYYLCLDHRVPRPSGTRPPRRDTRRLLPVGRQTQPCLLGRADPQVLCDPGPPEGRPRLTRKVSVVPEVPVTLGGQPPLRL